MSGSNFLEAGDPRHPLVNTGGFTKEREILFRRADESAYVTRLDGTQHAVRSTVTAFARKHSLHLFVTYMYDCHDEPTWYMVKPNDKPLSPRVPVQRHTIGKGPAQCVGYEKSVGGVESVSAGHHHGDYCVFAEGMKSAIARSGLGSARKRAGSHWQSDGSGNMGWDLCCKKFARLAGGQILHGGPLGTTGRRSSWLQRRIGRVPRQELSCQTDD